MAELEGRDALRYSLFVPLVDEIFAPTSSSEEPSSAMASSSTDRPSASPASQVAQVDPQPRERQRMLDLGPLPEIREKLQFLLEVCTEKGEADRIDHLLDLLGHLDSAEKQTKENFDGNEEDFELRLSVKVPAHLGPRPKSLFGPPPPTAPRPSVPSPAAAAAATPASTIPSASPVPMDELTPESTSGLLTDSALSTDQEEEFDCPICFDIYPLSHANALMGCTHKYCQECFVHHFLTKINSGEVSAEQMICPDPSCGVKAEDYELESILEPADYAKYLDFLAQKSLQTDGASCWCPNKDCREAILAENTGDRVACPLCHTNFCRKCSLTPFHQDETCEQAKARGDADLSIQAWMAERGSKVKPCPSCRTGIEKNDGCNHMTCQACKHQWCWLCTQNYSSTHYSTGTCSGLQFARFDTLEDARRPATTTTSTTTTPIRPTPTTRARPVTGSDATLLAEQQAYERIMLRQAAAASPLPSTSLASSSRYESPASRHHHRDDRPSKAAVGAAAVFAATTAGLGLPLYIHLKRKREMRPLRSFY